MARPRISNSADAIKSRAYFARPGERERQAQRVKDWNARNNAAVRKLFAEFRADGCVHCGEKHPACLEAHHRDPTQKEFRIWQMRHRRFPADKFRAELAKCDCICANCHRKLHDKVSAVERMPKRGDAQQRRVVWIPHADGS